MKTLRYVMLANGQLAVVSSAFYVLVRRETFFEANRHSTYYVFSPFYSGDF